LSRLGVRAVLSRFAILSEMSWDELG
jgi:hypothetical protein